MISVLVCNQPLKNIMENKHRDMLDTLIPVINYNWIHVYDKVRSDPSMSTNLMSIDIGCTVPTSKYTRKKCGAKSIQVLKDVMGDEFQHWKFVGSGKNGHVFSCGSPDVWGKFVMDVMASPRSKGISNQLVDFDSISMFMSEFSRVVLKIQFIHDHDSNIDSIREDIIHMYISRNQDGMFDICPLFLAGCTWKGKVRLPRANPGQLPDVDVVVRFSISQCIDNFMTLYNHVRFKKTMPHHVKMIVDLFNRLWKLRVTHNDAHANNVIMMQVDGTDDYIPLLIDFGMSVFHPHKGAISKADVHNAVNLLGYNEFHCDMTLIEEVSRAMLP